jgi:hypothetical protein
MSTQTKQLKNKLFTFRLWSISDNNSEYCYKSIILAKDVEDAYYTFSYKIISELRHHKGLYTSFDIPDIYEFKEYCIEIPYITFNYKSILLYAILTVDDYSIYEHTEYKYFSTENAIDRILRYKFEPIDSSDLALLLSE